MEGKVSTLIEYQKENESLRSQLAEANKRISDFLTRDKLTGKEIKEHNLTEEALYRSETMCRTLYESTSDAVMLLDEDGFLDCNKATLELYGCTTKEEFCSKHPADLSPPIQPCGTDSMTLSNQRITMAMEEGSCQFEWEHIRLDNGKVFFAEVRLNKMVLDGKTLLQASVRDITERKKHAIEALQASEEAFRGTFNQAAVGIAHVGLDGTWLKVNKKLRDIVGYTEEELRQLTFQDITHPDDLGTDLEYVKQMLEGTIQTYSMEKRYIQKSGDFIWINLTVSLVRKPDGAPNYFISVVEDISERKQAEEKLIHHMKHAQMGEMIAMIAHQWRQPLSAISSTSIDLKMQIELEIFDLTQDKGREECQAYFSNALNDVNGYVQSLTSTIDDFRNFYKPDKQTELVSFYEPVSKAINIIKGSFISDGIEIIELRTTCIACNMKTKIYTNEMMQVILNILTNSQDNFIEKEIKDPKITITCQCGSDDKIAIEICDNGGGIPEDILPKIFDPYFSTKDDLNGTGLGLYMSKTIVEDHHNGKLQVSNRDDGVCFTIELYVGDNIAEI